MSARTESTRRLAVSSPARRIAPMICLARAIVYQPRERDRVLVRHPHAGVRRRRSARLHERRAMEEDEPGHVQLHAADGILPARCLRALLPCAIARGWTPPRIPHHVIDAEVSEWRRISRLTDRDGDGSRHDALLDDVEPIGRHDQSQLQGIRRVSRRTRRGSRLRAVTRQRHRPLLRADHHDREPDSRHHRTSSPHGPASPVTRRSPRCQRPRGVDARHGHPLAGVCARSRPHGVRQSPTNSCES